MWCQSFPLSLSSFLSPAPIAYDVENVGEKELERKKKRDDYERICAIINS